VLLDENMQLKKIHGGQEAVLDTTHQQKEKREEIREMKDEIQALNNKIRQIG
jgi:predicted RNase H-like nuclease (RuvC/YqgF family)